MGDSQNRIVSYRYRWRVLEFRLFLTCRTIMR